MFRSKTKEKKGKDYSLTCSTLLLRCFFPPAYLTDIWNGDNPVNKCTNLSRLKNPNYLKLYLHGPAHILKKKVAHPCPRRMFWGSRHLNQTLPFDGDHFFAGWWTWLFSLGRGLQFWIALVSYSTIIWNAEKYCTFIIPRWWILTNNRVIST